MKWIIQITRNPILLNRVKQLIDTISFKIEKASIYNESTLSSERTFDYMLDIKTELHKSFSIINRIILFKPRYGEAHALRAKLNILRFQYELIYDFGLHKPDYFSSWIVNAVDDFEIAIYKGSLIQKNLTDWEKQYKATLKIIM